MDIHTFSKLWVTILHSLVNINFEQLNLLVELEYSISFDQMNDIF